MSRIKEDLLEKLDTQMQCSICKNSMEYFHKGLIMNKYTVNYHKCIFCGIVAILDPHWLDEAYNFIWDHDCDTGRYIRNETVSKIIKKYIEEKKINDPIILDFGSSIHKLMEKYYLSDYKVVSYDKYVETNNIDDDKIYDIAISLEVSEHIPLKEVNDYFDKLMKNSNIFLMTGLIDEINPPKCNEWNYYATLYGQHITFFTRTSMEIIAKKYNKFLKYIFIPEIDTYLLIFS